SCHPWSPALLVVSANEHSIKKQPYDWPKLAKQGARFVRMHSALSSQELRYPERAHVQARAAPKAKAWAEVHDLEKTQLVARARIDPCMVEREASPRTSKPGPRCV